MRLDSVVKIAVIGCGRWGPNHIRNFESLPGSRVVVASDQDAARLTQIQEVFSGVRVEQDAHRVLHDSSIDAVVIATPTNTHYALVREALEAEKHVLCEKPLCETSQQARNLGKLAQAHHLVLMVGHTFLFNAGIVKVKELCDQGEVGTPYYLSAVRTNLGPIRTDVNTAYDLATHDISVFNWLLNCEPEIVSATGGSFLQPGVEDVVFITLKYPGNVLATIQASWLNPKKVRQITVVGSQRMVTWDDLELSSPVAIYNKGANTTVETKGYGEFLRVSMWEGDVRLPKIQMGEPLRMQSRYFLDAIQQGRAQRSDAAFAVGVIEVLEAATRSLQGGGIPVEVAP